MILPSCPFPPISWYHLAYQDDSNALIEVHENYVKQSIRNRILLANSQGVWDLTLPVHRRKAESRLIEDIVFTDQMDPVFLMKNIKTRSNCNWLTKQQEKMVSSQPRCKKGREVPRRAWQEASNNSPVKMRAIFQISTRVQSPKRRGMC